MVTAEADVVLLQLDGPKGRVELAVLVLAVGVDPSHKAQQQQHHQDDDGKDDDVELRPGDLGEGGRCVVRGAAQACQLGLGGGGGAQKRAGVVATGRGRRDGSGCGGGGQSGTGRWRHGHFCGSGLSRCGEEPWHWSGAVVRQSVPYVSRCTELTAWPRGIVDAAEAVPSFRMTDLSGPLKVGVPTAVAGHAQARLFVEASAALVALGTRVFGKAAVAHWRPAGIGVAGAVGRGVGAGTGGTVHR